MTQSDTTKPLHEVKPHPGSYCDRRSRLFTSGDRILRGLTDQGAEIYNDLAERGAIKQLLDEGLLIETWVCEQGLEGWDLLLEHRRVPFVVAPSEWSAPMFFQAGKTILRMQRILAEHGYAIYDPHPWNILFDGPHAVYIDFGSIRASDPNDFHWMYYATFEKAFVHSLRVLAAGHGRAFRALFRDYNLTPSRWEIEALAGPPSMQRRARDLARRIQRRLDYRRRKLQARRIVKAGGELPPTKPNVPTAASLRATPKRVRFMDRMISEFEKLKPAEPTAEPVDKEASPPLDRPDSWEGWQPVIAEWIERLDPKTLIDIGESDGWYARLASSRGVPAISLEPEERRAGAQYREALSDGTKALPIVANPRYPTPGYGVQNTEVPAATSRLRGELVIATGMTKDYREWHYPPWMAAKLVTAFTTRWAIFEVLPLPEASREDWAQLQWGDYAVKTYADGFIQLGATVQIIGKREDGGALLLIEHAS